MEEESGQGTAGKRHTQKKGVVEWGTESGENAMKSPVKTKVIWKKMTFLWQVITNPKPSFHWRNTGKRIILSWLDSCLYAYKPSIISCN